MKVMSNIHLDFVATNLRLQIERLNSILGAIEDQGKIDRDYTQESLKKIEINIHQLRKLCLNH